MSVATQPLPFAKGKLAFFSHLVMIDLNCLINKFCVCVCELNSIQPPDSQKSELFLFALFVQPVITHSH